MRKGRHMIIEREGRLTPLVTNGDVAFSVIRVRNRFRVMTARVHIAPCVVKRVLGLPMGFIAKCCLLARNAATRLRVASLQVARSGLGCVAAITATQPQYVSFPCSANRAKSDESPKSMISNVNGVFAKSDVVDFIKRKLGLAKMWGMLHFVSSASNATDQARGDLESPPGIFACFYRSSIAQMSEKVQVQDLRF